jgi:predicted transposase/invertase (TIGR01784 family)
MAVRYLDPRNDLVFKRIFGEHEGILRSFLNALLPLPEDGQIVSLQYLPSEQVPELPLFKNTIVDVRCKDQKGRQFIVEMQMNWTNAFLQRVLFNASKAYVRQLERSEHYEVLQPVIGLSLLDDVFQKDTEQFYHHYQLAEESRPGQVIEGIQLVFIELPKFKPEGLKQKLAVAWWVTWTLQKKTRYWSKRSAPWLPRFKKR